MAMDKETLLQRLQSQYLTRQEVLYKLPLNISINSFWPELLERRKQSSTLLPLHGADGKPLWYVLTDKMIAASEKLCATALDCPDTIDPYKMTLTSAMTEELFFTSFVEGAQIDLQAAMSFLERGGEPENVQEQLIHNNRAAWTDMLRNLFYPLDDRFLGALAYRLTEDMDGHATEYRQTDQHPIAVMRNEAYQVPTAASIPTLMEEFHAFMANTDVHPLIKAAVGHAFLLVTRPYPEGNERLARMVSYTVLLRSGYDYFRNISISSLIATESFRYYKSMQDIIRSENGGDLTYFIEYYLDLLARAIDAKADQERRRQKEALRREREAAMQPLARPDPPRGHDQVVSQNTPLLSDTRAENAAPAPNTTDIGPDGNTPEIIPTESPPIKRYTPEAYLRLLQDSRRHDTGHTQSKRIVRIFDQLHLLVRNGPHTFTRVDWERMTSSSQGQAEGDIRLMMGIGLIHCGSPATQRLRKVYFLPLLPGTVPSSTAPTQIDLSEKRRDILLQLMDAFPSTSFSTRDASLLVGSAQSTISYHLDALSKLGILNVTRNTAGSKLYIFSDEAHGIFQTIKANGEEVTFRRMAVEKTEYSPLQEAAEAG